MAATPRLSRLCLLSAALCGLTCLPFARWSIVGVAQVQEAAAEPAVSAPCKEIEEFLKTAKIGARRDLPVGITVPSRATLSNGTMEHDASIQVTDVSTPDFESLRRTSANLLDSWKFNVAGYELAKLLSLNMVPPYVERNVSGKPASLSWWVNDTMMERERVRRKITPPQGLKWLQEMYAVRIFRQLIYDTDPNQTNLLITKDWRLWMIDFTRAFRETKQLADPKDLVKCDRRLLANLRLLTPELLQQQVGRWLTNPQIDALLARRDLIVGWLDNEVVSKGEAAVLYDLPRNAEPCGTGLR